MMVLVFRQGRLEGQAYVECFALTCVSMFSTFFRDGVTGTRWFIVLMGWFGCNTQRGGRKGVVRVSAVHDIGVHAADVSDSVCRGPFMSESWARQLTERCSGKVMGPWLMVA